MLCPHCGQEHPDASRFCTVTGKVIESSTINCPNCGRELPSGIIFCTSCGKVLDNDQTNSADKIKYDELESFGEISEQEISIEPVAERAFTSSTSVEVNTDSMIACPGCGTQQPEGTKFCTFCGAKIWVSEKSTLLEPAAEIIVPSLSDAIGESMVVCQECNTEQPEGTKFCTFCGAKIGTFEKSIKPEQGAEIIAPSVTKGFVEPMVVCPECGKQQLEGTKFCTVCGAKISNSEVSSKLEQLVEIPPLLSTSDTGANPMIVCSGCGTQLPEGTKFCTLCGTFLSPVSNQPKPAPVAVTSADTVICPNCTDIQLATTKYCTVCGTLLQSKGNEKEKVTEEINNESLMRCPNCGIALSVSSKFCTSCGMFLTSAQPAKIGASSPFASVDSMGEAQRIVGRGEKDGFLPAPASDLKARSSEDGQSVLENRICGFCGMTLGMSIQFCPSCGTSLDNTNLSKLQAEPLRRVVHCSFCSLGVPEDALYCPSCGSMMKTGNQPDKIVPEASVIVCKFCGFTQPGENSICVSCGATITSANEQVVKDKTHADKEVKCNTCGEVIPGEMKFCPSCGAATQAKPVLDEKRCAVCDEAIPEGMAFCPSCGAATQTRPVLDEKRCAVCGEVIPEAMAFCPSCGAATQAKLVVDEKRCATCGEMIPEGMAFCSYCGAATQANPVVDEKRCAACGELIPEGMAFCPSCGAKEITDFPSSPVQEKSTPDPILTENVDEGALEIINATPSYKTGSQTCPVCGHAIQAGLSFCLFCGSAISKPTLIEMPDADVHQPVAVELQSNHGSAPAGQHAVPCPNCGKDVPVGLSYCLSCGASMVFIETTIICPQCGVELPENTAFCTFCGTPVSGYIDQDTSLEKKTKEQTVDFPIEESITFQDTPELSLPSQSDEVPPEKEVSKPLYPLTNPCPNCGVETPSDVQFCTNCGASVLLPPESPNLCLHCGNELRRDAKFCVICGYEVDADEDETQIGVSLLKEVPLGENIVLPVIDGDQGEITYDGAQGEVVSFPVSEQSEIRDSQSNVESPVNSKISCPTCGLLSSIGTSVCTSCGTVFNATVTPSSEVKVTAPPVVCEYCNLVIPADEDYCTSCGRRLHADLPPRQVNDNMAAKRVCRACGLISEGEVETCSSCGASFSDRLVRDVPKPPLKPFRSSADDREGESRKIKQLEKNGQPSNKDGAREASLAPVNRSMKPGLKLTSEITQDLLQKSVNNPPRRSFMIIGIGIAAIFFIAVLGLGGKMLLDRSGSGISSEDAALTLIATQYKPIATLPAISLTQLPDESLQNNTIEDILPTSTVVRKKTTKPQKTENLSPTAAQENTNADITQIPAPAIQISGTLSPNQEVPTQKITPGMTGTVVQDLNSGIKVTPAPMGAVEPQTKVNEVDGATLILIPSGEFLMGSDNRSDPYYAGMEGPPHLVSLKDYWIYRTEVTNAMYKQCVEAKACTPPKGDNLPTSHFPMSMFENHPVVQINWEQAQSYCSWTGGRLPTEAEWEKAARGTDGRRFPWGIDLPAAKYLNYCDSQCSSPNRDQTQDDKYQSTAPVGSFLAGASPYGMLDMAGNVEEWVSDWYAISYKANLSKENPTGPENGIYRVIRGGSWIDKDIARLRVVARIGMPPTTSFDVLGFRCVVDKK